MPGLLRGVARTAVVAGTATAVSGRVQRRQAGRFAARDASAYAPAVAERPVNQPPAASTGTGDAVIDQLTELAKLKAQGILSDEEFAAQKARILAS